MPYKSPKRHIHREFLYLNHDTILNSLSALEAGKVDEIIHKVNEAREGGFAAGLTAGPAEVSGGKKKSANIEEEIVRTRTVFSAFDSWYKYLDGADAFGSFDEWNKTIRDSLNVGDTLEFKASLSISPVHQVFRTFLSYAQLAETPGSVFHQKGEDLKETKKTAQQMIVMLGGKDAPNHLPVYMAPLGQTDPRVLARLDEKYLVSPKEEVEGEYQVIAQVDRLLESDQEISAIRLIRDVPPSPMELKSISEALGNFVEPAESLGIDIREQDISLPYPAVLVRPIAVFR